MKILDRHQFHGAAMIQIAEHRAFTAINAFRHRSGNSTNAYTVNDNIGVYLKYASEPHGSFDEYKFTFSTEHLAEIEALKSKQGRTFIALVCWKDREVCCLRHSQLRKMIAKRRNMRGADEDSYSVYVRASTNEKFRVYVSPPGKKGEMLGVTLVARNAFPGHMFARKV
jgi:hypothetical protein